jgi:7-cyano-7-deazaguanine reductase
MKRVKKLKGLDRRYDAESPGSINVGVIEVIPYKYKGKTTVIDIDTDEFTTVCPYSGLPDFGRLQIHYIPRDYLIELRSLKYYLHSYRNVGIYQEHALQQILHDLIPRIRPQWIAIELDYKVRGGLHTVARAEAGRRKK